MKKLLKTLQLASILFIALSYSIAKAQLPPTPEGQALYSRLMTDFYDEVDSMDGVVESQPERAEFIAQMKATLQAQMAGQSDVANPTDVVNKSWSHLLPAKPVVMAETKAGRPHATQTIRVAAFHADEARALDDVPDYVRQRLGPAVTTEIVSHQMKAMAYGGEIHSALHFVSAKTAYEVPSFYSAWGIRKYLIFDAKPASDKPLLIYTIPPSLQYSKHYALMFASLKDGARSVLDLHDRETVQSQFKRSLGQIASQLGHPKLDFISLGYSGQWTDAIADLNDTNQHFTLGDEVSGGLGLKARLLTIQANGHPPARVLTLTSDQTIWGESSAFVAEAALDLHPRGFLFFGSAGGISERADVYDVSVPVSFSTERGHVAIQNLFQRHSALLSANKHLHFDTHHGHSNSPLEQTYGFLEHDKNKGLDTVDVEQSLVAETIVRHNKEHGTNVVFGAANIVTDDPGHILTNSAPTFNLDNIRTQAKAQARLWALQVALDSITTASAVGLPKTSSSKMSSICKESAL